MWVPCPVGMAHISGHITTVLAWWHGSEEPVLWISSFFNLPEIMFAFLKYYIIIILNIVLLHHCTYSSNIMMHLYLSLGFYAFQSVFFVVIYYLWIIHSSYLISVWSWRGKQNDRPPMFTYWHCLLFCSSSNQLSVILLQYLVLFYYGNVHIFYHFNDK